MKNLEHSAPYLMRPRCDGDIEDQMSLSHSVRLNIWCGLHLTNQQASRKRDAPLGLPNQRGADSMSLGFGSKDLKNSVLDHIKTKLFSGRKLR